MAIQTIRPVAATSQSPVFLRYWGSHFKTARQIGIFAHLFRPLVARGWQCHLGVERLPEDGDWLHELSDLGVELHCLPRPSGNMDLSTALRIRALCRQTGCTLFQCDNIAAGPLLGALLARVPVRVWYKRSMNSHYEACRTPTLRDRIAPSTRLSCRLATHVVAVSSAVGDELLSLGLPASKLFVHNNPRPEWSGCPDDRESVRREFGYHPSDVVILNVGRAEPVKAWDLLLPAFARVAVLDSRAKLLLAGSISSSKEQEFMDKLHAIIARHGLQDRVRFTGHLTRIQPVLAAADVFVMPSRSEGCSNALVEALGAGLPCVATMVGSASELLGRHPAGILVNRNDVSDLGDKLLEIVTNDDRRAAMSTQAQIPDFVLCREKHAERLADYFESFVPGPRKSASVGVPARGE